MIAHITQSQRARHAATRATTMRPSRLPWTRPSIGFVLAPSDAAVLSSMPREHESNRRGSATSLSTSYSGARSSFALGLQITLCMDVSCKHHSGCAWTLIWPLAFVYYYSDPGAVRNLLLFYSLRPSVGTP